MNPLRSFRPATLLALLVLVAGAHSPIALASDSVATMASIVLSLQHFPSDAAKETLGAIANGDGSAGEKTVAKAIAGIQHKVTAEDKAALEALAADESQPAGLRELATIVANLNHMPDAGAKAALEKLAGG